MCDYDPSLREVEFYHPIISVRVRKSPTPGCGVTSVRLSYTKPRRVDDSGRDALHGRACISRIRRYQGNIRVPSDATRTLHFISDDASQPALAGFT